jgi:ribosomal protein S18 acetylase RimI-like enzyme
VDPLKLSIGTAVRLDLSDLPRLKQLCVACSGFYELVEGQPANEATAAEILGPLEPRYAHGTKYVWGVEVAGSLIAVTELLQGHPSVQDWYIGLILVVPEQRRKGVGTELCLAIGEWIRAHGARVVRLVVHKQNLPARNFWERQGFAVEREVVKQSGRLEGPVWILARSAESSVLEYGVQARCMWG